MTPPDTCRPTDTTPQLPALSPGIQLLETDRTVDRAIHALAVDHVLLSGGTACWIDAGGHARSDPLVDLAPSARILDRVRVARAFTPFQHRALVSGLPGTLTDRMSLLVLPAVDGAYRSDDLLGDEGRDLLLAALATLAALAREHDLPVLVTRRGTDGFAEPVERAARRTIRCESTPFGPRFRADGEETLVYPSDCGQYVQTTLAFWERVLTDREPLYERPAADSSEGVTARGTN